MLTQEDKMEQLRKAREKRVKAPYKGIARVSEKRKKEIEENKLLLEQDKEFYKMIWDASPHKCQCGCNAKLGKEPMTTFFHHLLPKARYEMFRHSPENIMILHPDCHNAYHSNPLNRPEVTKRQIEATKILLG